MKYLVIIDKDRNIVSAAISEAKGLESSQIALIERPLNSLSRNEFSFGPIVDKEIPIIEVEIPDDQFSLSGEDLLQKLQEKIADVKIG
jgi:F0F1-type ATP synthase delta subunit